MSSPAEGRAASGPDADPDLERQLDRALDHAAHLLPAQAPLGDFVHHNTLHAFQHLRFHDAIAAASAIHDAEGYLSEAQYREAWREGRIEDRDVDLTLGLRARDVPDERIGRLSRRAIERIALRHGIEPAAPQGLRWAGAELGVTRRFRDDVPPLERTRIVAATTRWARETDDEGASRALAAIGRTDARATLLAQLETEPDATSVELLWDGCRALAPTTEDPTRTRLLSRIGRDRTLRDLLVAMGAPDPASSANAELVRFLGAYLDAGIARWPMPERERGLLACFQAQLEVAPALLPRWLAAVRRRLVEHAQSGRSTRALVRDLLAELGTDRAHWSDQVARLLLQLPGWSGMVARLEHHPFDRGAGAGPASLLELLAIRLLLDVECVARAARAVGHAGPIARLPETARRVWGADERRRAHDAPWRLFQLCQLAGMAAPELLDAGPGTVARIVRALDDFDEIARRRVLHDAYESHYARETLGAIADNVARPADPARGAPRFQVAFCIDDREESIRRHFEELGPDRVTLGIGGFFGVAMHYRGLDEPSSTALCPVVVQPTHHVHERPMPEHEPLSDRRRRVRRLAAWIRHEIGDASRSMARGIALTALAGWIAAVPLATRVLFPLWAQRTADALARWLVPAPRTTLTLARPEPPQHAHAHADAHAHAHADEGASLGFTLAERVERIAGALTNMGLTRDFARLVVLLGHGASTVNNPHQSAYECGACGGRNGGPNARAFAAMANDPAVREGLRARDIDIPATTWFVGGLHDTTTDEVRLFDLEAVPPALASELDVLRRDLDRARAASAHERCRRFAHARADLDPDAALEHVEERAVDLSQARPELGHATNAACVVGRRALTRGLFLDRRAFLVSYDPAVDDDRGSVLERILAAMVPVGAGISLEYYFSTVDQQRWGAGTKLPHNLAALLGVMEGTSGDLRTGLPRQMIEVHEPMRLLCVVEATPDVVLGIARRQPEVAELVTKGWVQLACVDPDTGAIDVLGPDGFEPFERDPDVSLPVVRTAAEHYAGRDGFLGPVRIEPQRSSAA